MKKIILLLVTSMVFLWTMPVVAEDITIVGTGSGPVILEEIGKDFKQNNPGINVVLPRSIGSGGGIKAVGKDEYLLGRVARAIKPNEVKYGLNYLPIARLPIVFYVSRNVSIDSLPKERILDIYSGKIFNWQQLGGHNARIRVVRRQDGDSSLNVLRKLFPGFKDITISEISKTTYSDPDTVEFMEKTTDAIAFGSYTDIVNLNLKALKIDGISPVSSAYPYYGVLALVFKKKNKVGNIGKYIAFATSSAASGAIRRVGALPILE